MSSDEHSDKECPLCMEPLEVDDIYFYPCKCGYQICRFCWHRIRTDENGLCPACRQPYPEDPVNFKPLSFSDVQKMKTEKKQKQQQQRIKLCESRKHLSSYRVLQKNLVYVVGLSARVADPEILKKPEYFGKYGKIIKIAVGTTPQNGQQAASFTAYVTFARFEDALKAIQAVNNVQLDGRIVKASLGTTKYCSNFLRNQPCHKSECMYLHNVADLEISFTKEEMHLGRHSEYEKKLIESLINKSKYQAEAGNYDERTRTRRNHSHSQVDSQSDITRGKSSADDLLVSKLGLKSEKYVYLYIFILLLCLFYFHFFLFIYRSRLVQWTSTNGAILSENISNTDTSENGLSEVIFYFTNILIFPRIF
ncbi:unnamed protein product [Dracunculus medinensis]|uniref:CCR4-NOT transcription complex subunit 4 n=1 Tax=Dracunculus medinensis TaxID=318479 RepID=A0A0N4U3L0_DRAME|nr:unnamed protein product [Dracunculus medinensis]